MLLYGEQVAEVDAYIDEDVAHIGEAMSVKCRDGCNMREQYSENISTSAGQRKQDNFTISGYFTVQCRCVH